MVNYFNSPFLGIRGVAVNKADELGVISGERVQTFDELLFNPFIKNGLSTRFIEN